MAERIGPGIPTLHASTHNDSGTDEISAVGLNGARVDSGTTNPVSGNWDGRLFYNTTDKFFYRFNGSTWDKMGASAIHNLVDVTNHPVAGLTVGHVLQALTSTTYGFASAPKPFPTGTILTFFRQNYYITNTPGYDYFIMYGGTSFVTFGLSQVYSLLSTAYPTMAGFQRKARICFQSLKLGSGNLVVKNSSGTGFSNEVTSYGSWGNFVITLGPWFNWTSGDITLLGQIRSTDTNQGYLYEAWIEIGYEVL